MARIAINDWAGMYMCMCMLEGWHLWSSGLHEAVEALEFGRGLLALKIHKRLSGILWIVAWAR